MSRLEWDQAGQKVYEAGVDHGVLFPQDNNGAYPLGVAWNGLINVTESPSGAEPTAGYADNIKYLNQISTEEFGGTIEAYTHPDEFYACDGQAEIAPGAMIGQQGRKAFGMVYRTKIGNDIQGTDYGYKLHIVYGAMVSPSEKSYGTINDSPEANTLSWEFTTTPITVAGFKPTANTVIDSTKTEPAKLTQLEEILFGSDAAEPRLPLPNEVAAIIGVAAQG